MHILISNADIVDLSNKRYPMQFFSIWKFFAETRPNFLLQNASGWDQKFSFASLHVVYTLIVCTFQHLLGLFIHCWSALVCLLAAIATNDIQVVSKFSTTQIQNGAGSLCEGEKQKYWFVVTPVDNSYKGYQKWNAEARITLDFSTGISVLSLVPLL